VPASSPRRVWPLWRHADRSQVAAQTPAYAVRDHRRQSAHLDPDRTSHQFLPLVPLAVYGRGSARRSGHGEPQVRIGVPEQVSLVTVDRILGFRHPLLPIPEELESMKNLLLRFLVILSGALVVIGTAGIGPAQAAFITQGIDVPRACLDTYGPNYTPKTVGTTAYDWRCSGGGHDLSIDMPGACHRQVGPRTVDRISNFYDIYSWQCWSVQNSVASGGLDLNRYCTTRGYRTYQAVGSTAYDWRCVRADGTLAGIDTTVACHDLYGNQSIDRFRNFYDRNSWECWY
jgi:hypothetical protein